MSLVKWTFVGLLALPVAEIIAFMLVASTIGWLPAVVLFLGTSVFGVLLLKKSGIENLIRLRDAVRRNGLSALHLETPGLAEIVGGILLTVPGFITDLAGLALFISPLRQWAGAAFGRAIRQRRRQSREPSVIDLEPDQWHQVPDATPRSRRPKRKPRPRPPPRSEDAT